MDKYVFVSVKILYKVKEKLERLCIKLSILLRKAIMEELRRKEVKALEMEMENVKDVLDRMY